MTKRKKRFVVEANDRFHEDVKSNAAKKGLSIKEYVLDAIGKRLYKDLHPERDTDDQQDEGTIIDGGERL